MKIIITENKVFNTIYDYIDSMFTEELNFVYGYNYDVEDEWVEDENFIVFYVGDYYGQEEDNVVFNYFDVEYYEDEPSQKPFKERAPILEVVGDSAKNLNNLFGDLWEKPMKNWFEDNFNLPVKSVSTYY